MRITFQRRSTNGSKNTTGLGRIVVAALFCSALSLALVSHANAGGSYNEMTGGFVIGADVGFNVDPDSFALAFPIEYHVTENVAIGPLVQLGLDDKFTLFGVTFNAKYKATLLESERLKPYGQVGLGFLLVDVDSKGKSGKGGGSSTEVLLPIGGGFEYWAWDDVALGGNFLVNITDDTYFSLLFGARYLF